jgi:uncharacterized protein (DUF1778 family)
LNLLKALKELPAGIIISAKTTLTQKNMDQIINVLENPPQPTEALKKLMHDDCIGIPIQGFTS